MTPLRRRGNEAPAPFVVGVGRSGTTLLRLMLDAHPLLAIPPETHFVPAVIEGGGVEAILGARGWGDFGLDGGELRSRAAREGATDPPALLRAFYELYAEQRGKPRWGDKTPIYVTHMRAIGRALPEARFVHLIRDGRDVALSRRRRGMGAGKPMADTARRWRKRIEDARRDSRRLRGRYLELRYEDLVAAPEPRLREICELIELQFDPAMLAHERVAAERLGELGDLPPTEGRAARPGEERLSAHALAARAPTAERIGVWRTQMGEPDRREFEAVAGELLAELGYDVPSAAR